MAKSPGANADMGDWRSGQVAGARHATFVSPFGTCLPKSTDQSEKLTFASAHASTPVIVESLRSQAVFRSFGLVAVPLFS